MGFLIYERRNLIYERIWTKQVLGHILEEYSDCLVSMAKVLKKRPGAFFSNARSTLLRTNEHSISDMINNHATYTSETAKTRFILMDVYDILKG